MTALGVPEPQPVTPTCTQCRNRGYYLLMVAPSQDLVVPGQAPKDPEQQMMFCKCEAGRDFRALTIEFRLGDIEELADILLPALSKAQANLHTPSDASKILQGLIESVEKTRDKIRKAYGEATA